MGETDLISRQAVINALDSFILDEVTDVHGDTVREILERLPSAQPEPSQVARDIATIIENEQDMMVIERNAQQWIPCSERLPSDNREVEVTCEVKRLDGKKYRYTCHASYVHRYSIESTGYNNWEECDEYNEEEDKYYALPGWYERVHNWDDYSCCAIEDYVLSWRELSEPYKGEQE